MVGSTLRFDRQKGRRIAEIGREWGFSIEHRYCRLYPTMTFEYEESGDGFLVTLRYQKQKISSVSVSTEGISEGITGGISEGINLLLEHIQSAPGRRIPQLADHLGIPAKTIERWIADLKRQGCVEYRGSKKSGGYYTVNEKGQKN
ncbi:MAG: hypothetical protein U9N82_07140 [Thermodesulfobacteriota bacterium]|nr:hypothetical protein [Thermodesulfobacteriota bacterium]